jgi:hypothetical protein
LEFGVGEKASIFAQGKWIGTFGGSTNVNLAGTATPLSVDLSLRNFAIEAGVSFSFGE